MGNTSRSSVLSSSSGHLISFSVLIKTSYLEDINNKLVNSMYYTDLAIKFSVLWRISLKAFLGKMESSMKYFGMITRIYVCLSFAMENLCGDMIQVWWLLQLEGIFMMLYDLSHDRNFVDCSPSQIKKTSSVLEAHSLVNRCTLDNSTNELWTPDRCWLPR